jgi:hypothetical protein
LHARALAGPGLFVLLLAACEAKPERPAAADILAARQAALEFEQKMQREIVARLERDEDPVAIYLAYDAVPGWGKEISDAAKFDFSRTSLTPRNPDNVADAWEQRKMEEFSFLMDAGLDPSTLEAAEIVQEGEEKVFRWLRPIVMTEACLVCHGETLDPRIKLLLGQEYPDDGATGYGEGQLGGAYSVRKVLSVGGKPPPRYQPKPLAPAAPADRRAPGDAPLVSLPQPEPEPAPERSPYDLPADPRL